MKTNPVSDKNCYDCVNSCSYCRSVEWTSFPYNNNELHNNSLCKLDYVKKNNK